MKRRTIVLLTIALQFVFVENLISCSCGFTPGSFCESISEDMTILLGKRIWGGGSIMEVEVLEGFNNVSSGDTITVYGNNDASCLILLTFPVDTFMLALYPYDINGASGYGLFDCAKYYCWYYNDTLVNAVSAGVQKMAYTDFVENYEDCLATNPVVWTSGKIVNWVNGDGVAHLAFKINNTSELITGLNGEYGYYELEYNIDTIAYSLVPTSNSDITRGVSTIDLIAIMKHIQGIELLDKPEKLIAADINNSESITMIDVLELRKVILGIESDFQELDSWRFVDNDYVFPDISNPWLYEFPESINQELGNSSCYQSFCEMDFKAIKIGDVNGSYINE